MEVVVILKGIKCLAFTATLHEVTIMQDDVILLLQPESFRALLVQIGSFLIYTSLWVPNLLVKGKPEKNSGQSSKIMPSRKGHSVNIVEASV